MSWQGSAAHRGDSIAASAADNAIGGRVNTMPLMQQRQNGILLGVGTAIVGTILFLAMRETAPASNQTPDKAQAAAAAGLLGLAFAVLVLAFYRCRVMKGYSCSNDDGSHCTARFQAYRLVSKTQRHLR